MISRVPLLACACLALGLAACATHVHHPDRNRHAGRREPHATRASLFISPMGEPFRAAPGEPYPVARWFARVDRNGDGRIDHAEFLADAKAFFAVLDSNHDGVIDGFELQAYEQQVAPEILGAYHGGPAGRPEADADSGGRHRRMHRGGSGGGPDADRDAESGVVLGGAAAYGFFSDPEPVASADRTLSGRITLADFLAAASARFERLDIKSAGYVTLDDMPRTAAQRGAGRP